MNQEQLDIVACSLKSAFLLGQKYWSQADSESIIQQKKSDETYQGYLKLISETLEKLK